MKNCATVRFFVCNSMKICYNSCTMKNDTQNPQNQNIKQPLFGERTPAKGAGLAFSLSSLLPSVLFVVVLAVLGIVGLLKEGYNKKDWYIYISYLLPQISAVLITLFYLRYTQTPVKKAVCKQKCAWKYMLLAVALQFGLFSLSELNSLFISFLEKFGYQPAPVPMPNVQGFGFVGVFLVIAVLAPMLEEILFRGVILEGIQSGFSTLVSVLICGAMFSLYHQNPVQTVYQFCCGVAYALLAVRAGSVLPTILAHFLNNAYILILYKCGVTAIPNGVFIPLVIVSALCLVATLLYLFFFDKKKLETELPKKSGEKKHFFLFACVGIVVCAFTWIIGLFS